MSEQLAPVAEYLKRAETPPALSAPDEVKQTVSEMLSRIEREGMAAIREYSERLDRWNPESFRVGEYEIRAAGEQVGDELREHMPGFLDSAWSARDQLRSWSETMVAGE
jgi:histidinol dehydrogenase